MAKKTAEHAVAVDLGGTKILAAVVGKTGEVLCRVKARTPAEHGYLRVLAAIASCVEDAIELSKIARSRIGAIGMGVPGPLDPDAGIVKIAPNLNWKNVPVKEILEGHLGIPVFIENDVNAGTLGEHRFGAGIGVDNMIGVFVGTGIGGGLVFGGRLHHGFGKVAGEVGHMIIDTKGPRCGCGNRGCFEALASRTAIVRDIMDAVIAGEQTILSDMISMKDLRGVRSSVLADAYRRCDNLTVKIVKRAARHCGIGVASLLNLLNPEMVVLGGGMVEAFGDEYVKLVANAAKKRTFAVTFKGVRIVPAVLGDDAVLLGAASLAFERATGN